MPLQQQQLADEPRYDAETLRKVTALAQRLQSERQETLTAREMEAIGSEVGVEPVFVRQALERVTARQAPPQLAKAPPIHVLKAIVSAWWAVGWMLPFILIKLIERASFFLLGRDFGFFLGWGIYIAGGILLSGFLKQGEETVAHSPYSSRSSSFTRGITGVAVCPGSGPEGPATAPRIPERRCRPGHGLDVR